MSIPTRSDTTIKIVIILVNVNVNVNTNALTLASAKCSSNRIEINKQATPKT